MKNNRRFISRLDLIILFAAIALSVMLGLVFSGVFSEKETVSAVIYHGGSVYRRINLTGHKDDRIKIEGHEVLLEIKNHRIAFADTLCPDRICERTGFIGTPGQTAVCAPNRVAVIVISDKHNPDKDGEVDVIAT
ncbi:MAG: NusG domain II-containing protein [Oscillospiraceae bacterium]|nr:NusG domain II-containing protein [Oscillospiraceae bacterium]